MDVSVIHHFESGVTEYLVAPAQFHRLDRYILINSLSIKEVIPTRSWTHCPRERHDRYVHFLSKSLVKLS